MPTSMQGVEPGGHVSEAETFFTALVEQVEPDEVDVAVPMLRAHLDGSGPSAGQPSAAGFGMGGVVVTPTLVTALSSAAVIALPLLRALIDFVIPSIGAAADVTSIRDMVKSSTSSEPDRVVPIKNIPRMAELLEQELVDCGLDPARSSDVTLTCIKALLSSPEAATALMSELETR